MRRRAAAAYVLHLVRDKGLRYRDIRLIYNDLENRGDIIERVFEEYGIELFSDVKRDIMDSPIIKYITSLLDVVIEKIQDRNAALPTQIGIWRSVRRRAVRP